MTTTSLKIPLQPEEIIARLEALFLNRVDHLKWYYFQIDLNGAKNLQSRILDADAQQFIEKISPGNGGFVYPTAGNSIDTSLSLLLHYIRSYPEILRSVIRRIFDSNDILNESGWDQGQMGVLNAKDRERRNKAYNKKMRDGFRRDPDHIVVMAEGDSWFEFPRIGLLWNTIKKDAVTDIVDHIMDDEQFAVFSLAAGGDWLSNMLRTGEYIEELPKISPNALLVSGGGNDMVGERRLASMVINPALEPRRALTGIWEDLLNKRTISGKIDRIRYANGLSLLSDEFFSFLNVTMTQYFLLYKNLSTMSEYQNMLILTQGYDFVIPTAKRRKGFWRGILNRAMDTGHWLNDPLMGKGIIELQDQRDVMYVMINEFNEMMIQLANYSEFKNVFHIDCRGVAQNEDEDWFDEMHLSSKKFGEIANTFKKCMRENLGSPKGKKVYRVVEG